MSNSVIGSIRQDFQGDFLGFTFNGRHSSEFGIVRVSSSNRYEDKFLPTIKDITAEVPGGDGAYYFGSQYTKKDFSISIAFDSMSQEQFNEVAVWLGDQQIHELIFDETSYKAYYAKCTGTPSLKYLCFNTNEGDVYKGEGTIQFTAYYPFAHSQILNDTVFQLNKLKNYIQNEERVGQSKDYIYIYFKEFAANKIFYNQVPIADGFPVYYTANSIGVQPLDNGAHNDNRVIQIYSDGSHIIFAQANGQSRSLSPSTNRGLIFAMPRANYNNLLNKDKFIFYPIDFQLSQIPNNWNIVINKNYYTANKALVIKYQWSSDNSTFNDLWSLSLLPEVDDNSEDIIIDSLTELITLGGEIKNNWIQSGNFLKMPVMQNNKYYRFIITSNGSNITNNCTISFKFLYY